MEILNSKDIHKQALAKIRIKYLKKQKLTINREIKKLEKICNTNKS